MEAVGDAGHFAAGGVDHGDVDGAFVVDDGGEEVVLVFVGVAVDEVDDAAVAVKLDGGVGRGHVVDQAARHIVLAEDEELDAAVERVGCLLVVAFEGVDVVALHDRAGGEDVVFAVVVDHGVLVQGAGHTLGVAFSHKACALDAAADEVVDDALGAALGEGVVGEADIGLAVGVGAYFNHEVGVVFHDDVEVHERVHELGEEVGLAEVEADFGQDDGAARDGLHAEVADDGLVGVVAAGAFAAFEAVVALLGEVEFVDHVAADEGGVELVEALFVGGGLGGGAVGADEADADVLHKLH